MVRNKARFVPRRVARATRTAFRDTVVDRGDEFLDICGHRVGPKAPGRAVVEPVGKLGHLA